MTPTDYTVYDHVRPPASSVATDAALSPGVYRVVGVDEGTVTLLRVGDADGYRVNTGAVATVDRDALAAFEPADNPDGDRPVGEKIRRTAETLVWNLRAFVAGLLAHPVLAVAALALVVVGHQGHRVLSVPEPWLTAVYFLGVLGVVYLGVRG
ncbi:hypothetical protein C475_03414 [Halosimplex carlsbadense 2-9-1]|uniref:Uncharacterized protein n=1 Tax=Halosimplex carlsbadense 2-9-1 TaxID=797114 RepID=M0D301_9EURY|nr:hypothetical protein [Halosimplex carlsbadense]ELZ29233.1 hypothetical protein C475_03414 [Halosimplex carlsbadense 2-9-1]